MRSPEARGRLVAALAVIAGTQLVAVPLAAAAPSCSFDATTHVATATLTSITEDTVAVTRDKDDVLFGGQVCGTVTTLDRMEIDLAGTGGGVKFDLRNGPFAPGFTDEGNGTSEIEFRITNAGAVYQTWIVGTGDNDSITVGDSRVNLQEIQVLNLNAGSEPTGMDNDVSIAERRSVFLDGGDGDDSLLATGTGTFASCATSAPVAFSDGPGADRMAGGYGDDLWFAQTSPDPGDSFSGGTGDDTVLFLRLAGVAVSLDDVADDGEGCPGTSCEGDNIASDVESVTTGPGDDVIVGGPGKQRLDPGQGSNVVRAGDGRDTIVIPGLGPDTVHGGAGHDAVSYETHDGGVEVTLDGTADDGNPGEGDRVSPDVEEIFGTTNADRLVGSAGRDLLHGGEGDDRISGGAGSDLLDGGGNLIIYSEPPSHDGSDILRGGPGVDTVLENAHTGPLEVTLDGVANDMVVGDPSQGIDDVGGDIENVIAGPFDDTITGSSAANRLTGGGGDDVLRGRGGEDRLIGGEGDDRLDGGPRRDVCNGGPGRDDGQRCEVVKRIP